MLEPLTLLGEAMKADDSIPKDLSNGLEGVYMEPCKEEIGLQAVTFRILFWRPNTYGPGMGTLFFDVNLYDNNHARLFTTMAHITEVYPIPLSNQDGYVGDNYRMDELHFIDARTITKPKLTTAGGGVHHLPIQAYAVIKPISGSS